MFKQILSYLDSVLARDPAARGRVEVALCYPGVHALAFHRLAHWLWRLRLKLLARIVSSAARFLTGIEIHPAASIGKRLFIDHGFGVVIGETASIGDDVTLYHAVTLGGTSLGAQVRHPQLGNGVIVGAGAQLLGPISVGDYARIGPNAVVVGNVPAGVTVAGMAARIVDSKPLATLSEMQVFAAYGASTPEEGVDPWVDALTRMAQEIRVLQERLQEMEEGGMQAAKQWEAS